MFARISMSKIFLLAIIIATLCACNSAENPVDEPNEPITSTPDTTTDNPTADEGDEPLVALSPTAEPTQDEAAMEEEKASVAGETVAEEAVAATADDESEPAEEPQNDGPPLAPQRDDIERSGVVVKTDAAQPGYNLYAPHFNTVTHLINNDGAIVHTWDIGRRAGGGMYLMEDGSLMRAGQVAESEVFAQGLREGAGGIVQHFDWDSNLLWEMRFADDQQIQHHDIEPLPNGNVLVLLYVYLSAEEAIAIGRNPELIPEQNAIWSESLVEVNPTTNEIVWEWHATDHIIQNANAGMPNYGFPSDHPELIDFNYFSGLMRVDWVHMNAVDYNAELDQIVLSAREFSEIWIIDHSTTTEEAASHEGGRYGLGGDLLFRWGNPAAYGEGEKSDQIIYLQHDSQWIKDGLPGAGNILIFDNGSDERPYSTVVEIAPVQNEPGVYVDNEAEIVWRYPEQPVDDFYSFIMGGIQRQPNGNTLIAESYFARVFEVDPNGERVWDWYQPGRFWVYRMERYPIDFEAFTELE